MASDVDVNISSLPGQVKVWDEQSTLMGKIESDIEATQQSFSARQPYDDGTGLDTSTASFLFGAPLNSYKKVLAMYGPLVTQGKNEMKSIGDALNQAYKNYQATEKANTQSASNVS